MQKIWTNGDCNYPQTSKWMASSFIARTHARKIAFRNLWIEWSWFGCRADNNNRDIWLYQRHHHHHHHHLISRGSTIARRLTAKWLQCLREHLRAKRFHIWRKWRRNGRKFRLKNILHAHLVSSWISMRWLASTNKFRRWPWPLCVSSSSSSPPNVNHFNCFLLRLLRSRTTNTNLWGENYDEDAHRIAELTHTQWLGASHRLALTLTASKWVEGNEIPVFRQSLLRSNHSWVSIVRRMYRLRVIVCVHSTPRRQMVGEMAKETMW